MKTKKYVKNTEIIDKYCHNSSERIPISGLITKLTGRKIYTILVFVGLFVFACGIKAMHNHSTAENIAEEDIQMISLPVSAVSKGMGTIAIPTGTVKANPFLPYREMQSASRDVPDSTLLEPPYNTNGDSDAVRVMDTIVSGILYDKYSPSAIINIGGVDYLVKKGDTVNNYKVLNIMRNSVTVKLGANVYEAGIGEILTSSGMNSNTVSNLNKKFGGSKQ